MSETVETLPRAFARPRFDLGRSVARLRGAAAGWLIPFGLILVWQAASSLAACRT
jgi:hypothetical protein